MVSQTRDVLDAYAAAGGEVTELALEGAGHTPHLERPAEFRHALLEVIGYVGHPARPRPADRGDHPQVRRLTPRDARQRRGPRHP